MTMEQWNALRDRDPQSDGAFLCGLMSSKTVCRPSCTHRVRQPQNIIVFSSYEEAAAQGYAPCSYCRPDKPQWRGAKHELVQAAKTYIEAHSAEKFSLRELSGALFVNGSYLLRTFRELTGSTLLWYHNHIRCENAKRLLEDNQLSISAIGERTGFTSSSHVSRVYKKMEGISPTRYRSNYYRETFR